MKRLAGIAVVLGLVALLDEVLRGQDAADVIADTSDVTATSL